MNRSVLRLCFLVYFISDVNPQEYPSCPDNTNCNEVDCIEVPISQGGLKDVLCIDNSLGASSVAHYLLRGCPHTYFHPTQNTSGVCRNRNESSNVVDGPTDLYLTTAGLANDLHEFVCFISGSATSFSYAAVVDEDAPHASVRMYKNGIQSENATLDIGDEFTVFILAIGGVSVSYPAEDGEGTRFICNTGFPCKQLSRVVQPSARYYNCTLTQAQPSDDGRSLNITFQFASNETLLEGITLSVNEGPLIPPTIANDSTVAPLVSPTASLSQITAAVDPTATLTDQSTTPADHTSPSITYTFTSTISPIVSSAAGDNLSVSISDGVIVAIVVGSCFIPFLCCCTIICSLWKWKCTGRDAVRSKGTVYRKLSAVWSRKRKPTVLVCSCLHCDQAEKEITSNGFSITKLPRDWMPQNDKEFAKLLNKGVPLLSCSCSECAAFNGTTRVSAECQNWEIAQLLVSDEHHLEPNERVKLISYNSDDAKPVRAELAEWLRTKQQQQPHSDERVLLRSLHHKMDSNIEVTNQIKEQVEENATKLNIQSADSLRSNGR